MVRSQVAIVVLLFLFFEALAKADGEVKLEALCSMTRAGAKWKAVSQTYRGQIHLHFNCTNSAGNVTLTDNNNDNCFHKTGGIPLLAHIRERSMTHVISRDLEPETICTFTAHIEDQSEELLEIVTASCTIGGSDDSKMPAVCNSTNGTECECECSPGFEGESHNSIDGNTCEEVPTPTPSSDSATTSTVSTSASGTSTGPFTSLEPNTITDNHIQTSSVTLTITRSTTTMQKSANNQFQSKESTATTILGLTEITQSPTSNLSVMPTNGYSNTQRVLFATSGVAAVILTTIVCLIILYLGAIVYTRKKQKRWHKQQTMPFRAQKLEKIDPYFHPENLKMNDTMIESESLHSIIHTLQAEDKGNEQQMTTTSLTTIASESYSENSSFEEKGECMYNMSSGSSGYGTEGSFFSESLISKTSAFMESVSQENYLKVETQDIEFKQGEPLHNSDNNLEINNKPSPGLIQDINNLRQTHSEHTRDKEDSSEHVCVLLPQDYIMPVLRTHVSFNFPSEV